LTSLGIKFNALYATDAGLITFLNAKDPDWAASQTVAPTDVVGTPAGGTTIVVTWTPIAYQSDSGGYIVSAGTASGGPYTQVGQTATKSVASMIVSNLTPGTPYYFVVKTHTDAHTLNQSALESEETSQVSAATLAQLMVSGTVLSGGLPLSGVTMNGLPGPPVTNAQGVYQALVNVGWTGTVTPFAAGYTFTPASQGYTGIVVDQWNQDYEGTLAPTTVTVTSPNGGEAWLIGSAHDITWTQTGLSGSVSIDLYKGGVFQEVLGMAAAIAGTFPWTIATGTTLGTDYTIRVWQGGGISDYSNSYFAIVSAASSKKTDFNGDGQEDILWRYYGSGGYQGWNVVWLMNQTQGLLPMGISQDGTMSKDSLKGSSLGFLLEAPLDDTPASRQGHRALDPMGIATPYQKPKGVLRSPIEDGRRIGPPTMKDAEMAAAASGGEMKIASLGIDGYLYLDTLSDLSWEIAGTGDFDGDTDTDILWRNYGAGPFSGWNVVWYMNTTGEVDGYGYLSGITDLSWRIVGTGDLDGDGDTDILWRNYGAGDFAGWNVIWYLNGETIDGYGYLPGISDLDWKIMGTGDFNRDGYLDILWRNCGTGAYSGWNVIWYMAGEGIGSYGYLSGISDLAWEIAGTGDFNNDGYMDILWRNYGTGGLQGWNCIWYMQGEGIIGYDYPMTIPDTNWRIVNR
jgi:hypothetical protein